MEQRNNAKKMLCWMLFLVFASVGANAQTVDLNKPVNEEPNVFSPLVKEINKYEIIKGIANNYDLISVSIDGYVFVLEFEGEELKEIREYSNEDVDLELYFSKEDVEYLFNNWQSMSDFDKIMFFLRTEMPVKDIMTFGAIALSVR